MAVPRSRLQLSAGLCVWSNLTLHSTDRIYRSGAGLLESRCGVVFVVVVAVFFKDRTDDLKIFGLHL